MYISDNQKVGTSSQHKSLFSSTIFQSCGDTTSSILKHYTMESKCVDFACHPCGPGSNPGQGM